MKTDKLYVCEVVVDILNNAPAKKLLTKEFNMKAFARMVNLLGVENKDIRFCVYTLMDDETRRKYIRIDDINIDFHLPREQIISEGNHPLQDKMKSGGRPRLYGNKKIDYKELDYKTLLYAMGLDGVQVKQIGTYRYGNCIYAVKIKDFREKLEELGYENGNKKINSLTKKFFGQITEVVKYANCKYLKITTDFTIDFAEENNIQFDYVLAKLNKRALEVIELTLNEEE